MNASILKMLAPMAKQNLPMVEKALCQRLNETQLIDGETYAAYVLTVANDHAQLSLCAFTHDDQCQRIVESNPLIDELLKLLKMS